MVDSSENRKMRILFVDDERRLIQGLRRLLHAHRDRWDMEFVISPTEALELIEQEPFDVVVSDMRMPVMNGAELLRRVMEISPQTIRMILSGQSEASAIMKAVGPSHQFLSKPCDPERLKACIERAQNLRQQLENPALLEIVGKLEQVPSVPSLYSELVSAIDSEKSIEELGRIIAKDIGMTARVLQLVNSSYFGIARRIECPEKAVSILGTEILQSLVFAGKVFEAFKGKEGAFVDEVARRSERAAVYARQICQIEKATSELTSQASLAAFLHDIGWMVLAAAMPDSLEELRTTGAPSRYDESAERRILGTTHGEIGAYLLGIWGIPVPIAETVAWHSAPHQSGFEERGPLPIVHFAQVCAWSDFSGVERVEDLAKFGLDLAYLEDLELMDAAERWVEKCMNVPVNEVDGD